MSDFEVVWTYPFNLSLLYPGVSGPKFKPFSKTDFSDGESCFSNMLNMIEPPKYLVVLMFLY